MIFHNTKAFKGDAQASSAPQSGQPAQTPSRWTGILEQATASRVRRSKRSMALVSACGVALLLPTALSSQSKAQSENSTASTSTPVTAPAPTVRPSWMAPISNPAPAVVKAPAPTSSNGATVKVPTSTNAVAAIAALPEPKIRLRVVIAGKSQTSSVAVPAKATVGVALKAMGITVNPLDRVSPEVSTPVRNEQVITIQRVAAQLVKKYVAVPAQLLYRPTTAISAGTQQQVQSPRQGKIEIVERVWTLNGKETRREFVSKKLSVAPQPRIIALGARSNVMPGNVRPHKRYAYAAGYINSFRGGSPRDRMANVAPENQSTDTAALRPVKCIEGVLTTGYSAGPSGGSIGSWTATGVRCTYGAVAVDPRLIPLGTKMYIEGYGYGFACDTGGAIKGKHIDLAFDSAGAAMAHGKRRARVWILGR